FSLTIGLPCPCSQGESSRGVRPEASVEGSTLPTFGHGPLEGMADTPVTAGTLTTSTTYTARCWHAGCTISWRGIGRPCERDWADVVRRWEITNAACRISGCWEDRDQPTGTPVRWPI